MSSQLDDLFSKQAEETKNLLKDSGSKAPDSNVRKPVLPGVYVMKTGTFAWKEQNGTMRTSPEFSESRNGAILLSISLYVDDEGTEVVPPKSSIFHTLTIIPTTKDQKKVEDTVRMTKPQLTALTGAKVEFIQPWLKEHCEVQYEQDDKGTYKLIKDHKMKERVLVTVDERLNKSTNQPKIVVVKIEPYKPGDKSVTRKYNNDEDANEGRVVGDSVPGNVDISPEEEKTQKSFDTTKITGKGAVSSEEEF